MKKIYVWFGILFCCCFILISNIFISYSHTHHQIIYLQAVTQDSVYVMAESRNTEPLKVDYGRDINYGKSATTVSTESTTGGTYVHRIHLTGLDPDTNYYYQLGNYRANFKTAAKSGSAFDFVWMADIRTNTDIHDAIAKLIMKASPRFSLYGGDLCKDGNSYSSWRDEFFRSNQLELAAYIPFFNVIGNHEHQSKNAYAFTQAPASASDNQLYYSFDYGDLHVVVMNCYDPNGFKPGSPQYDFIVKDLKETNKPWKIVASHAPAYAVGKHGENADMIEITKNVFEPLGVNLVLSGHNHYYQRNYVKGIYHLIIGSAGGPLDNPGPVGGYTQVSLKSYCWAIFDVTPTALQIHVYDDHGAEIDTLELLK